MSEHHRTAAWQRFTAKVRPILKASLPAPCVQPHCQLGGTVYPDQPFDVAHIVPPSAGGTDTLDNVGPAHRRCNRSDGGKAGRALQMAAKAKAKRMPSW